MRGTEGEYGVDTMGGEVRHWFPTLISFSVELDFATMKFSRSRERSGRRLRQRSMRCFLSQKCVGQEGHKRYNFATFNCGIMRGNYSQQLLAWRRRTRRSSCWMT